LSRFFVPAINEYVTWYAKDRDKALKKFRPIYSERVVDEQEDFAYCELESGEVIPAKQLRLRKPSGRIRFFSSNALFSQKRGPNDAVDLRGKAFPSGGNSWKISPLRVPALDKAERTLFSDNRVRFKRYSDDFAAVELSNVWSNLAGTSNKVYVVQTNPKVIERCMLMTTDPGDLVLDPTCGGGTTAYVAEHWGRRWITCDTSRVALAIARQRVMTARFPFYKLRALNADDVRRNPQGAWLTDPTGQIQGKATFSCKLVPHVKLSSIARNTSLDPIFDKHEPILAACLRDLNGALKHVSTELRQKLTDKLIDKQKHEGKKSITEADRRRWELPKTHWQEWEVPFDTDPSWPQELQQSLTAYRSAWRMKMDEVNACIATNADVEELVDKPDPLNGLSGVMRVTGPFTVEGVRPEELSLGNIHCGSTAGEFEPNGLGPEADSQNLRAYLSQMVGHLRSDGLTFLGNQQRKFANLDPLFEDSSASLIHAEGAWDGANGAKGNTVAVSFGPQHGPVSALQIEETIRDAKQYDDLVFAGFSFDAEAFAVVHEQNHPKLRIHLAHIRPDLNEAMDGLLKDTANSELFAVFGQPEIDLRESKEGWICTLKGVDIYNPLDNTVRSTGANKVAAWFLDRDFDGRCFCITQAFFPDQDAWKKISKALGSSADLEAFKRLKGTTSLPFPRGKYGRIAVKVIDPRGNEVMAIRKLN
jgi:adenine-specific DNA-methyltransferase